MATKYVSALDGGQMDSALMDMATHTSEAWAVGTRNGTPVSGSDVTYHNNSKYWADSVYGYTERAEDAAARAEAAVPAGTAGAVFFDRAQSLTTAQQMQAKANISAGGTNPNLLDNPFFTVRQRGYGPFSGTGFTADRWSIAGSTASATLTSNGISLSLAAGAPILQRLGFELELGVPYTVSILEQGGTLSSVTFTPTAGRENVVAVGEYLLDFDTRSGYAPYYRFMIYKNSAWNADFKAFKLEKGTVSTLANDAPPDYGTELAKCQRYFLRLRGGYIPFGFGDATSTTNVRIFIPTPVTMRAKPNASMAAGIIVRNINNASLTPTAITADSINDNGVSVAFTVTGATQYAVYLGIHEGSGSYIDLSADL